MNRENCHCSPFAARTVTTTASPGKVRARSVIVREPAVTVTLRANVWWSAGYAVLPKSFSAPAASVKLW